MSEDTTAAAIPRERFRAILETYGSAPERWPEAERGPAMRHLVQSRVARDLWESAAALDEDLDLLTPPPPSPGLVRRLMTEPLPSPARRRRAARIGARGLPWRLAPWPVALATIAFVAFVAGLSVSSPLRGTGATGEAAPAAQALAPAAPTADIEVLAVVDGAPADPLSADPGPSEIVEAPRPLTEVPLL